MRTHFYTFIKRWFNAAIVFLALQSTGFSDENLKRVLILNSFGQNVAPFSAVSATFRTTLAQELDGLVYFWEVPLDLAHLPDSEQEYPLVEYLDKQLKQEPMDLIVPNGAMAARFAVKYRERLFPDIPVLLTGADPRVVPEEFLQKNAVLVAQRVDAVGIIQDILDIKPETKSILMVFGCSPLEKFWVKEFRRELQAFTNRLEFIWLDGLTLEQVTERCANAPAQSFIMYGLFLEDAAGVPFENSEPLRRLHKTAHAPIYGYFESELGLGSIGGRLYQDTEVGIQSARMATRILNGESPKNIPPVFIETKLPIYDGRELSRWKISASHLPIGSDIRFREPGYWEQYWGRTLFAVLFIILQSALTTGLLMTRAKRRRAEAAARDLSRQLITVHEEERARLGRELHDDITQRVARLAIDAGRVEQKAEDTSAGEAMRSVRDGLVRLSEDIHALSYRLHPSVLEDLGLSEALKSECERFMRQENIAVEIQMEDMDGKVPRDTALCLFRVTQEALRNIARHAKASHVNVVVRALDHGLQLAVRDNGVGFDPSVQSIHRTLGLASMRERVHLLGGEIDIESEPGQGTTVVAWVPLGKGE